MPGRGNASYRIVCGTARISASDDASPGHAREHQSIDVSANPDRRRAPRRRSGAWRTVAITIAQARPDARSLDHDRPHHGRTPTHLLSVRHGPFQSEHDLNDTVRPRRPDRGIRRRTARRRARHRRHPSSSNARRQCRAQDSSHARPCASVARLARDPAEFPRRRRQRRRA